jgi:hypothetical protein
VRYQNDRFPAGNTPIAGFAPGAIGNPGATNDDFPLGTRFPNGVDLDGNGFPNGNVDDNVNRLRLRARLGVLAKISDGVSAGLRFTTGNTTDRVSTNQTLGSGFNKYSFLVDRAYIKVDPVEWLSVSGGRIPNPWFATDLVWDEDLNFDGLAVNFRHVAPAATLRPFATAGWFPLRADNPPNADKQWLAGAQIGTEFDLDSSIKLRFGLAKYHYSRIEARTDDSYDPPSTDRCRATAATHTRRPCAPGATRWCRPTARSTTPKRRSTASRRNSSRGCSPRRPTSRTSIRCMCCCRPNT